MARGGLPDPAFGLGSEDPIPQAPRTPPSDLDRIRPAGAHGDHLDLTTGSRGGLFGARARNHVDR